MIKKITQVGPGAGLENLVSGCRGVFNEPVEKFARDLSDYFYPEKIYLLNSGLAAFYIILETVKNLSSKKEVILPAYTAPSMVLPVLKANLKPVLCDIAKDNFNVDLNSISEIITKDTLCIVPTHLFGIPVSGIEDMKERFQGIFIIEDCAQSLGSTINGKKTGCFSNAGFTSFNRGKNLSTYGGGCIFTGSFELGEKVKAGIDSLAEQAIFSKSILPLKLTAFSLAVNPYMYGLFHLIISRFKDNQVPENFYSRKYSNFQAGVGKSLLDKIDGFSEKRYNNGMFLAEKLYGLKEIIVPVTSKEAKPAFNRFPVLFKNLELRQKIKNALWASGFDTSFMYLKPLHHIFDLGNRKEDFPNANYLAEHLLTLPVHPLLGKDDMERIIQVIKKAAG
ncbi:MAG: DegT/DnrJ/EryC1/StrS family aminotransferase [bacterium]